MALRGPVGHLVQMSSDPVTLSQQTVSWLLQAAGLLAEHRTGLRRMRVSPSTVKYALNRVPVLGSWQSLVDELLGAFGASTDDGRRKLLATGLRDWDQRVTRLDTMGLDLATRLPALLHIAAPQLGARFGALAALEEANSTAEVPVSDWLCEPLSPAVFGRTVEWLFHKHHPALDTWTARYALLPGVDRTTVEDWRSKQVKVPNVLNMDVVANAMGPAAKSSAHGILRVARILTVLRRDVAAWGGAILAEQFDTTVSSYARLTRQALTSPGLVADLADLYAIALEGPTGDGALAKLLPLWGGARAEVTPAVVAGRIRDAANRVRAGGDIGELQWVRVAQVLEPLDLLIGGTMGQLGVANGIQRALTDPLLLVQAAWSSQAFLGWLAEGAPLTWAPPGGRPPVKRTPSAQLRELARKLAEEGRQLCRRPDAPPPNLNDHLLFGVLVGDMLDGADGVSAMVDVMNRVNGVAAVPAGFEIVADDQMLGEFPHLMAERARRLAAEGGRDREALGWLRKWGEHSTLRTDAERRATAETATSIAHRGVDAVHRPREFLRLELPCPFEQLPSELRSKLTATADVSCRSLAQALATGDRLLEIAAGLLPNDPGTAGEVERVVALLPLAIRLDCLAADVSGDDDVVFARSHDFAERLQAADRALPDHALAWALRAVWQRLIGDDDALSLRWATHFGSRAAYDTEVARLVRDGRLAQEPR